VPLSLEKLLNGQWEYFKEFYNITAVSSDPEKLKAFGEAYKIKTFHVPLTRKITPFKDIQAILKLYLFLKKEKPQLVHTQTPKAGLVGMVAAFFARTPIRIHDVVGLPLMEASGFKYWLLFWIERLVYACAHQVYPNSFGLKEYMVKTGLGKASKLKVIGNGSSNGIDTQYFSRTHFSIAAKQLLREQIQILPNDFVFLFIGRLVGDKGINELLQAFSELHKEYKHLKLLLVGGTEEDLDPLSEVSIDILSNKNGIISVGFKEDVRPYLAIANCFVFPSYREGFPNVVLEAAAMELPCIVTDINGCNEIISHQYNGLIIPKKDIFALKNAMFLFANNASLLEALAKNARLGIMEKFQKEYFYKAMLEEYKKLESHV